MRPPLTTVLTLLTTLTSARGDQVCYDPLGCFSDGPPWCRTYQRPECKTPWTPQEIGTKFFLWTRENPHRPQTLTSRNLSTITSSSLRSSRRSVFIIHGMADRATDSWVSTMCQEMLRAKDTNCVGVDWRRGSGSLQLYAQAANNARVVGAEVAYIIRQLQEALAYPLENIHLIGHSLGAHAAGEAGRRMSGVRRITGLDPARPYFQDTPEEVRLDQSDARFVDVIHSDAGVVGAGMVRAIGHYDFYPNGGKYMTGCPSKLTLLWAQDNMLETVACNHFMSFRYYTHSFRHPDAFPSFPCDSYSKFTQGSCFPCPRGGCPTMGHYAERSHNASAPRLKLYLNTGGGPGWYSLWRYKVSLKLLGSAGTFGKIYISINGSRGNVTDHLLHSGRLNPGDTRDAFIDSPALLHPTDHVTFHWTHPFYNLLGTRLGAARASVQSGQEGTKWSFCSNQTVLDGVRLELGPCDDLESGV